jgi:ubiquinone/menaquinone biosynthesis C-methylase UbiE
MLIYQVLLSMNNSDKWFNYYGESTLKRAGFKEGQTVLDFGCGSGYYAIPVAKIIGEQCRVYALEKDRMELERLISRAKLMGLKNIVSLDAKDKSIIPLDDESVDAVLLYDVLHHYFYPRKDERRKLLTELWRVLKPGGMLSLFPTHLDSYMDPKLADIEREIKDANFQKEIEFRDLQMMHDGGLQKGRVINFNKQQPSTVTNHQPR